jgi:hypothetical protein
MADQPTVPVEAIKAGAVLYQPKELMTGSAERRRPTAALKAAARLKPGEVIVVTDPDGPGPGGNVLVIAKPTAEPAPGVPMFMMLSLSPRQATALAGRLVNAIEATIRDPDD